MKISATIICKNESAHIEECLRSIEDVDQVVLCDTGSTDNTIAIALSVRSDITLVHFPWGDHFAEARNAALSSATGDWCIVIDCDETLGAGTVDALRKSIKQHPQAKTFRFECRAKNAREHAHYMVRAHQRRSDLFWRGRIHETLTWDDCVNADGAVLEYGYSTAHKKDPDRALRLLQMDYDDATKKGNVPDTRTLYYLGREWFYRKNWSKAIEVFLERVDFFGYRAENADAWLYLARCYWARNQGNEAREAVLKSLLMVPDCREAMEFMAEISYEEQAAVWRRFASHAQNTGVLFVRTAVSS
jgi:glycosyltransferase involved in cell wall biosynthesis